MWRWIGTVVVLVAIGAAWTASSAGTTPKSVATPLGAVPDAPALISELADRNLRCTRSVDTHPPSYTTSQYGWPRERWTCQLSGAPVVLDVYASLGSRRYALSLVQQADCDAVHNPPPGHAPFQPRYVLIVYRANWLVAFGAPGGFGDPPTKAQAAPLEAAARKLARLTQASTYRGCPGDTARAV
jgi:hypothetical protein